MFHKIQHWYSINIKLSATKVPEVFVIIVLLVFGSFLAFTIPLGAGFDEETHLLRVWEMSAFEYIPNARLSKDMHFPSFYWENSYRRQNIIEPVKPNFWKNNASMPINGMGFEKTNLTTRSVYSPLLLLPQSLVMFFLGRTLDLHALTVLVAIRMAGLLFYTVLVWLAVRIAPFSKWMWAVLVLAPMAIYQASTVSTDSISNGIGFLFVSCCLYIATLPQVRWKEWLTLVILFILLFSAKVNLVILVFLPFFILPPSRFKMKRGFILLGIVAIVLALLEVGGWNILAYSQLYTAQAIASPVNQVKFIFTHPFSSISVLISNIWIHLISYIQGWIADYGYGYWGPQWLVFFSYIMAILVSFFIQENSKPDKRMRFGLLFTFGLSFIGTLMSLYILYNPVGSSEIQAVHGRYFSVIFPLLLLGLYGLHFQPIKLDRLLLIRLSIGITLISLLIFTTGSYLAYYRRCGAEFYRLGLCYQPVYKNWSPNSVYFQPISPDFTLTQWIMPSCGGMHTLRVWIDSSGSDQNGETEFILNDEENDVTIIDTKIPNSELPNKDWLTITFPVNWQSGGKWNTLTIKNPQGDHGKGIRVASSIQAEYIDAPLFENGTEIDKDMIFQYGCIAGWQKLIPKINAFLNKK